MDGRPGGEAEANTGEQVEGSTRCGYIPETLLLSRLPRPSLEPSVISQESPSLPRPNCSGHDEGAYCASCGARLRNWRHEDVATSTCGRAMDGSLADGAEATAGARDAGAVDAKQLCPAVVVDG